MRSAGERPAREIAKSNHSRGLGPVERFIVARTVASAADNNGAVSRRRKSLAAESARQVSEANHPVFGGPAEGFNIRATRALVPEPTTTSPLSDTPFAELSVPPGSCPRPTMPPSAVHRNASRFMCCVTGSVATTKELSPTITAPLPDTPAAWLHVRPGNKPKPIGSPCAVQRTASLRTGLKSVTLTLSPTRTSPLLETS